MLSALWVGGEEGIRRHRVGGCKLEGEVRYVSSLSRNARTYVPVMLSLQIHGRATSWVALLLQRPGGG